MSAITTRTGRCSRKRRIPALRLTHYKKLGNTTALHQRSPAAANGVSQDIYRRQNAGGYGKGIGYLRQLHEKPYAEVIRISAGKDKQVKYGIQKM